MTIQATLNPVVEAINKNGAGIIRADALSQARSLRIADAIGENVTPTYSEYALWKSAWDAIQAGTPEARRKRWSRLMKDCGVTIPASDTPEAQQKAKQREDAKKALDAMDDQALEKRAEAMRHHGEVKVAQKYEKELARREEARKPETIVKASLTALGKAIKTVDPSKVEMAQVLEAFKALGIEYKL